MPNENEFLLSGLHCAGCVRRVEQAIAKLPEVQLVSVNLADQTAFVQGAVAPAAVVAAVQALGFGASLLESEESRRQAQQHQMLQQRRRAKWACVVALLAGAGLMLYGAWFGMALTAENQAVWWLLAALVAVVMGVSGGHFFRGAWTSLHNRTATMDTLIALSTSVAWLYSVYLLAVEDYGKPLYFEACVMIIGFVNLGKFLELRAKQRASFALEKLLNLAPQQAVILQENEAKTLPVKAIKQKMQVQARTGDRLAVDGVLLSGAIWVDESMLTGEVLPVAKQLGDKVRAGTLVQEGAGVYQAEQVGEKTVLANIIRTVRLAQSSKPPIAKWVDRIAAIFVPVVVSLAVVSAGVWWVLGQPWEFVLSVFTSVLIIACPCALGLAIPLSVIAGVARSAELGALVRNIDALQALSGVDSLVFDKTGTLTTGEMAVSAVQCEAGVDETHLLRLVKTLEQQANHPIAHALQAHTVTLAAYDCQGLQVFKGLGVQGVVNGNTVRIGNAAFVGVTEQPKSTEQTGTTEQTGVTDHPANTLIWVSENGNLLGRIALQDQLRAETPALIAQWQGAGYQCLMLTGDRLASATAYGEQLGIKAVAELLPEAKAAYIAQLQREGRKVAMIGDGINDAPAMAQADVSVAMKNGSDIAIETADLSLMHKGLPPLAAMLPFAKKVRWNMQQNLLGAFIYNVISLPIAAGVLYPFTGELLNPMIAALAMTLSSLTVVLNSLRLLKKGGEAAVSTS
ncbi:heavy metal translocating P-type ATPase [[Haemophilus] felis]|nr:heavy metal translocating P-type ATPase [[Haemophilus] felis]